MTNLNKKYFILDSYKKNPMLEHNHITDNNILFPKEEKTYKKSYNSFELKTKKTNYSFTTTKDK